MLLFGHGGMTVQELVNSIDLANPDKHLVEDFNDELFNVVKYSKKVIGALHYLSVHPGGVIIVPDEICKYVPVLKAAKGVQIVQWEKDQVEDSGLLKIDLLGNRSLAVVRDTIRQINLNYGESASDSKYIDYHQIQPVDDEKTSQLLRAGKTMGVFYIESPAARQLLAKARVVDFKHIVCLLYTSPSPRDRTRSRMPSSA